jgi:hypothetical protein
MGTFGDFTDIILRVYAINDNGTLKWGVSNQGGLRSIVDTNSHVVASATSVTTQPKMLVNSALTAGTWPCREVGWFLGDFDDTGGSSEDLWVVQSGAGEIMVGAPAPVYTDWTAVTLTIGLTGGTTTFTGFARMQGSVWECIGRFLFSTVFTGGDGTITLPSGVRVDVSKMPASMNGSFLMGEVWCDDVGSDVYLARAQYNSTSTVLARNIVDDAGGGSNHLNLSSGISTTAPHSWANNDAMRVKLAFPIIGWSGN